MPLQIFHYISFSLLLLQQSPQLTPEQRIKNALLNESFDLEKYELFAKQGESFLSAYTDILVSGTATDSQKRKAMTIMSFMKCDRSSAILPAIRFITHEKVALRDESLKLLAIIARSEHCGAIALALCDERIDVVYQCALTLSSIGDANTLTIFDVWISSHHHRKNGDLRIHVVKCQKALKERLEKEELVKKKAEPSKK